MNIYPIFLIITLYNKSDFTIQLSHYILHSSQPTNQSYPTLWKLMDLTDK
jgi:hypothetical protein